MKTIELKRIGKGTSVAHVQELIAKLIAFEHANNEYILEMAGLFSNTSPENLVSVSEAIAEMYLMPHKAEQVYNIIQKYKPVGESAYHLSFASELAERAIFNLQLKSVDNTDTCRVVLTEKSFADLLIQVSHIDRIKNAFEKMSFYHGEKPFEVNPSNQVNFAVDSVFSLLWILLGIEAESGSPTLRVMEDCNEYVYLASSALSKIDDIQERREAADVWVKDILKTIKMLTAQTYSEDQK